MDQRNREMSETTKDTIEREEYDTDMGKCDKDRMEKFVMP